ncbi:UNVERIFIED_CONTAM: hypothetical protein Sradi_2622400 [Sesamum radiatum]|uniref:SWIM-type domain-containing protein n=1 Tax=Sesamum radiatum TaxID=300843 RepID=A0AAW2S6N6_SESRA
MWCSCGMFQLVGYPCCHAIAAIDYHRLKMEDFIDECFKKEVYLKVYSHMIHPVPGMHDFEDSKMGRVEPPDVIIKMGRPKKCRRKDANDVKETTSRRGLTHTCTICMRKGHKKKLPPTPPQFQIQSESGPTDKDPAPHMVHQEEGLVPHPFHLLMRMRQYNQRYLQFFPNHLRIQQFSPKFQFSPKYLLMIHHLKQPQETLLR